jgi:isopentenyldiphosphate isomerase
MAPHNPNALAEAQSASEMFDVMCPPIAGFDIYNDRAVPTGESKARGAVHAQKQWHRSVHVWLVDAERGLVALQKRSPNKDTFPNRWDISAAGHIESGDESRPTAVRELAEELGVICVGDDLEFLGCVPAEQADLGGCNCFEDVYLLRCDSKTTAFAVGEAEVTDVAWMPIHTLESKLKTGDPNVVPRTPEYQTAFFQKLREEYNYAGSAPVR